VSGSAAPGGRTPLAQSRVVLIEGKEDERFYSDVCRAANVAGQLELRPVQGWSNFARYLLTLLSVGFAVRIIAIIRDAESNERGAFQSTCSGFQQAGLPQPSQAGQLSQPDAQGRRTTALIVPPDRPGSIETLCLASLAGQPNLGCVQDFVACLDRHDPPHSPRTQAQEDKRRVGAVLAAGAHGPRALKIGARLGEAAEQGFWDWTHPAFEPVLTFVRMVASAP
jgi:hypothetical protein